jgi:uroporphyrinogen decarboxylase
MLKDEMTPKERIGAFLQGKPMDRLVCAPLILNHAAHVLGVKVIEHAKSGETMGKAHVAAFRKYGQDMITLFSDTALLAEAMGTKLYYPEDDAPRFDEPAVKIASDVEKIAPADPQKDGRLPAQLEAIKICNEEVGDEVFVAYCLAAPFTTAALLRGTDLFARDLYRNPEMTHTLLKVSQETALNFIDAVAEAGGIPAIVDPVATGSIISPPQFARFAAPYIKPLVERIHKIGYPAILHICGKTHLLFEQMADTGANVLSLDRIDLAEAKNRVGDRVCLMGNVTPAETLLNGTEEDVDAEVKECIRKAHDNPAGFILASGCEVPIDTPPENVLALMEAARKYGTFPIELG